MCTVVVLVRVYKFKTGILVHVWMLCFLWIRLYRNAWIWFCTRISNFFSCMYSIVYTQNTIQYTTFWSIVFLLLIQRHHFIRVNAILFSYRSFHKKHWIDFVDPSPPVLWCRLFVYIMCIESRDAEEKLHIKIQKIKRENASLLML